MTSNLRRCRHCDTQLTLTFADLGKTPLSNAFVTAADVAAGRDVSYPLHVRVCEACYLVQADDFVPHAAIFDENYMYFSSHASSWVAHAKRYQLAMTERFGLGAQSKVVEVASNDGYLLKHFVSADIPVLGVEPTASTARVAIADGVPTRIDYFGTKLAQTLVAEGHAADLTAANNVLAHVPDIVDFARGFATILKPEGVATFEFPHLLNLIQLSQFDTIYHEHYSYLSLLTVEAIFARAGLRVFDVETLTTHGGSLRVFACRPSAGHKTMPNVEAINCQERTAKLDVRAGYLDFQPRIEACCRDFRSFLDQVKREGKSIAAYGAAAKGNTFFNVAGVTVADIPLIADRSPAKQGKLLPGSHIPIVAPEAITAAKPDYLLIVPWNLADEISAQFAHLAAQGTRFVTAIPSIRIF